MLNKTTIANFDSRVREYTNFAVRGIRKTVKDCGPRPAGSDAERSAQQQMAGELQDCCSEVRTEEFRLAPRAFLGWIRLSVVLAALSSAAYNTGYAAVSAVLMAAVLLYIVFEFLLYKRMMDPFFRKKTSQNVVAVRKPAGEVRRRLILCGHADSAPEWTYTYLGDKLFKNTKLSAAVVVVAAVTMLFGFGISVASLLCSHGWDGALALRARGPALNVLGYVFAGLWVPMLSGWFFRNEKRYVDGANDNLSGCWCAMAVPKFLQGAGVQLEHTELMIVLSGAEEVGLRGAKAFVKAHKGEFDDVETAFVALDTLCESRYIGIYINDMHSAVKHDPAVCALLRTAANAAGCDVPYENLPFGASDAAAATQGGLRAATVAAMNPAPAAYYHTRHDTADKLDPKTIESCLHILLEAAQTFDEAGLAPFEGAKVAKMR